MNLRLKRCKTREVFVCEKVVGEEALSKRVNELMDLGWSLATDTTDGDFKIETFLVPEEAYGETTYRIMGSAHVCAGHEGL